MTPNWTFTDYVPETQGTVDIRISLFDRDLLSADDIIDIDPFEVAFCVHTGRT